MFDILEKISKISLIFQKDAIYTSQVKAEIERASQALENMQRRPGKHLAAFQEKVGMEQQKGLDLKVTIQMTGRWRKAK